MSCEERSDEAISSGRALPARDCLAQIAMTRSLSGGPLPAAPAPEYTRSAASPTTGCMEDLAQPLLDFIKEHQSWAIAMTLITGFVESFAFLSLLFPGVTLLIAAGTLMEAGALSYLPVIVGAILGAVLGGSVSYWIGRRFGSGLARLWAFRRNPAPLPSGHR